VTVKRLLRASEGGRRRVEWRRTAFRELIMAYGVTLLCVLGISAGQVVFKLTAGAWQRSGTLFDVRTASLLASALALYGVTTIAWIWVLRKADLGRVYPIMALAYILVPIGSHFVLGERFHPQYYIGVALIAAGIVLAMRG